MPRTQLLRVVGSLGLFPNGAVIWRLRLRDPTAAVWGWHFGIATFGCGISSRENTSGRNAISHTIAGGIALSKLFIHSHLLQVACRLEIVMVVPNAL